VVDFVDWFLKAIIKEITRSKIIESMHLHA
jgi:hypothetical protein